MVVPLPAIALSLTAIFPTDKFAQLGIDVHITNGPLNQGWDMHRGPHYSTGTRLYVEGNPCNWYIFADKAEMIWPQSMNQFDLNGFRPGNEIQPNYKGYFGLKKTKNRPP